MIRINNVKVSLGKTNYAKIISQTLNIREKQLNNVTLVKQSVDARRNQVHFVCSFDFDVENEDVFLKTHSQLKRVTPYHYQYYPASQEKVVVIGSGPAGLFCAYVLANSGQDVTVVERGGPIEQRVQDVDKLLDEGILNVSSNIAFGEGGAGTFSDGKLTTGIKNDRLRYVLETFVEFGAPKDILYLAQPHIGTDYLRKVIVNMRKKMQEMGVKFLFNSQFIDFENKEKQFEIKVLNNQEEILVADSLVLAIGHSARDTYELLYQKGLHIEAKPFAVGVRLEQSQAKINQIQYKKSATSPFLKAANYKLAVTTSEKRGVYTFCMCPGGVVVPSMNEDGHLCVNGMSYYNRDGDNANSAILVNVTTDDFNDEHPLAGIEFQRLLEKKAFELGGNQCFAPVQKVEDYIHGTLTTTFGQIKPTYQPGYQMADLNQIFPDFINRNLKEGLILLNEKMPGFIDENSLLTGVETRSSAPVRICRNAFYESSIQRIYPIGEGAGYAGGIMSAAVDGIMCAEMITRGKKDGSC